MFIGSQEHAVPQGHDNIVLNSQDPWLPGAVLLFSLSHVASLEGKGKTRELPFVSSRKTKINMAYILKENCLLT